MSKRSELGDFGGLIKGYRIVGWRLFIGGVRLGGIGRFSGL